MVGASGGPAGISHWFVCGTTTTTTTTTDTAGGSEDDLASTGLSVGAPLLAAGALMLLGAGLLAATRRRAFRRS